MDIYMTPIKVKSWALAFLVACGAGLLSFVEVAAAQNTQVENFLAASSDKDEAKYADDNKIFWRVYHDSGDILVTSGDEFDSLFRRLVYRETLKSARPDEGYGSTPFYADVVDYLHEREGLSCTSCNNFEEMKAFVDPQIDRIYGAMEIRTINGEEKRVLRDDSGVSKALLLGLGEIDIAHKKRGEQASRDFERKWLVDNKDRIRILSVADNATYRSGLNLSHDHAFSLLERAYPDGFPLFFDAAYTPAYRDNYAKTIRRFETRYKLSSETDYDLRDERMDDLLLSSMQIDNHAYFQRMSCAGGDIRFHGGNYNSADSVKETPPGYRRFDAIQMKGAYTYKRFSFWDVRQYQYLWDAGYRHTTPRAQILSEATARARAADIVYGGHFMKAHREKHLQDINGMPMPTYAECITTPVGTSCTLSALTRKTKELTSAPVLAYRFDFKRDEGTSVMTEAPYTNEDDAPHFSRGRCKVTNGQGVVNGELFRVSWSGYDPKTTALKSFVSRKFDYRADGTLASETLAKGRFRVNETIESVMAGTEAGTLDAVVFPYKDNLISGVIETKLKDWKTRESVVELSPGGDDEFYRERLMDVMTKAQKDVLWKSLAAPLIVEIHFDKGMPHGPFRLWTDVGGKKGKLLGEGRHDYGLILGTEGSAACRVGRCI